MFTYITYDGIDNFFINYNTDNCLREFGVKTHTHIYTHVHACTCTCVCVEYERGKR